MTTRRPLAAPLVAGLAALALLSGCGGIPTSTAPRIVEGVPRTGVTEEPDVEFQPKSPQPGQSQEEVVQAFIDAASSPDHQHAVARQYLTAGAAQRWRDAEVTVLARIPYIRPAKGRSELIIRGEQTGFVDNTGAYTSYPPGGLSYSWTAALTRVDDQWRISTPPQGVIMTAASFKQAYTRLNVYFLARTGSPARTGSRVIPDPRWLVASRDALPNLLMKALLAGPSPSLADAVTTELADGVSLATNVVPEADRIRVFLLGLAEHGTAGQAAASAQIVWTLNQLGAAGVEVYDDGQVITPKGVGAVQRLGDWRSYDPDELPLSTPGYFVRNGAVWTTDGRRVPGPAGRNTYQAVSVGVSRDLERLAVVRRVTQGVALYLGPAQGPLVRGSEGSSFSPPSWDPAGAAWTVRDGREILQVPARGLPMRVEASELDHLDDADRIDKLRLSRDGTRVAFLLGPPGGKALYVGAVDPTGSSSTLSTIRQIVPALTNVVDVAWATADSLVVLTRSGTVDATLWTVSVDGSSADPMTSSGLPGPPSAVAAIPGQPTLTVAEGGIWALHGAEQGWVSIPPRAGGVADAAPAYPG